MNFDVVVAADAAGGIGRSGELVWKLPGDTRFFKEITSRASEGKRNAVVMGRKTWGSIPQRYQPLAGRLNVVLTRQSELLLPHGVLRAAGIEEALEQLQQQSDLERVFVIGGGEIYRLAVQMPACQRIYLTRVEGRFDCDAFFPDLDDGYRRVEVSERQEENGIGYVFEIHARVAT